MVQIGRRCDFMSFTSAQAKVNSANNRLGTKCSAGRKVARIERVETSFGGKGCLTKEQYEKAMSRFRQVRDVSAR